MQSRSMLDTSYEDQRLALGSLRFSQNTAYLHHDASLMPSAADGVGVLECRQGD